MVADDPEAAVDRVAVAALVVEGDPEAVDGRVVEAVADQVAEAVDDRAAVVDVVEAVDATVATVAVVIAAVVAVGAGNRFLVILRLLTKPGNSPRRATRFFFAVTPLLYALYCPMLSLGDTYGHPLRRKRAG